MIYIFNSKKVSMSILLLVILFVVIKPAIVDWNINDQDNKKDFTENTELKIISKFPNPSNYLKIEMITESKDTQFIFSLYKESSLNNRTQLAQSISGKAFLYLTKEEFTNEFYIKTEFDGNPSKYSLAFTQKESPEISIGEQYTYYITKENKNMKFKLVGATFINYDRSSLTSYNTSRLSIWAKGSLDLSTTLSINENVHTKNTKNLYSYIVELNNDTNSIDYDFNVIGTEGDLIKIGVVLFSKYCICQTVVTDQNMEIIGFLKKGILEQALILLQKSKNLSFDYDNYKDYDSSIEQLKPSFSYSYNTELDENGYSFSGQNIEEKFYLMEFKKAQSNQNYIYPLQARIGATYQITLKKDEISSLLPMKTDSDFITYQVWAEKGTFKANILNCQNYPFCKIENNLTPLMEYNSASASYSSSEYGQISPIQLNQKILFLKCNSEECKFYVNIYTEKNNIIIYPSIPMYRFLRAGNEDHFIIDSLKDNKTYSIHLEILTELSNATITFEGKKYTKNSMILYEFTKEQNKKYPLKIKANDNTIYSIIIRLQSEGALVSQMNYLINHKVNTTYNIYNIPVKGENSLYFLGISPFDSEIEVFRFNTFGNSSKLVQIENYSQDKNYVNTVPSIYEKYKITPKNENSNENLLMRFSLFKTIENENGYDSIILPYNYVYPYIFNANMTIAKFAYLHPDNRKGFSLVVEVSNEAKYSLVLYINEQRNDSYTIDSNNNIINITSEVLKDKQSYYYQPIKINFLISPKTINNSELVKLKIKEFIEPSKNKGNGEGNNNKSGSGNDDKTKRLILIIGCSAIGVLVVVVVIVIILLFKNKKSYDKLKDQVNSISFKKDEALQRDSKDDDLLE